MLHNLTELNDRLRSESMCPELKRIELRIQLAIAERLERIGDLMKSYVNGLAGGSKIGD